MKPITAIESIFLAPEAAAAMRLSRASELGGAKAGELSHLSIRDIYYDTPGRSLEAAGWSYRLRDSGDRTEACLRSSDQDEEQKFRERFELGYPSGAADPTQPPGELGSLLSGMIASESLEAIAVLCQERDRLPLFKDGAMIAELDIDRIRAGSEDRAPTVTLVEVVLTARGSISDLEDIRAALVSDYGLVPEARTELEIALSLLGAPARPAFPRTDRPRQPACGPQVQTLGAAPGASPREPAPGALDMREFAKRSMAELSAAIDGRFVDFARKGDPASVHDLRVAARKTLMALDAFGGYLEAKAARRAEKELKRLVKAFGRLRDLDIVIEDARARSGRLSERRRAAFEAFISDLDGRRADGLARLREKTGEQRQKLAAALGSLTVVGRGEAAPVAAADAAPALALEAYAGLRAESARLEQPPAEAEAYHALRLEAKRLRYLLELIAPMLGPSASTCVSDLRLLQDKLGAMSDAVAAVLFLREYLAPGRLSPSPEVAVYLAARQAEAERLARSLPRLRERVAGPSFRRRLMAAIAAEGKERA